MCVCVQRACVCSVGEYACIMKMKLRMALCLEAFEYIIMLITNWT